MEVKRDPTPEEYQTAIRALDTALANTRTYVAFILKASGGSVDVPKDVWMGLNEHFEVVVSRDDDKVTFKLLEGQEAINVALGRTPGGLVVPNS